MRVAVARMRVSVGCFANRKGGKPRGWIGILLAGALLWGSTGTASAQPVIQTLTIDQVSWEDMSLIPADVPDSEYGHFQLVFEPDTQDVYFLNIVARLGTVSDCGSGPDAWIIDNLPLLDQSSLGGASVSETASVVDLASMGAQRGTSEAGNQICYTAYVSLTPILTMPSNTLADSVVVGSQRYSFGGETSVVSETPTLPSPTSPTNKESWNGQATLKLAWRIGMGNEEQGKDQCGPAAIANSIHWLATAYPTQVDLGGQTWNDTLLKLKGYTNWDAPTKNKDGSTATHGGIGQKDAIEGKLRFAQDEAKSFDPALNVKYQADEDLTDLGASVTVGEQTAYRNGGGKAPTYAWLLSQLQEGRDVEISIDWLRADGTKAGGHVVSVVGAMRFGNKMFLWTNDDNDQGQKTGDPAVPPANGGLRTNMLHQVTIENGGYMRLNGFRMNNRVKATYSEGVEAIKPEPTQCCTLADGTVIPGISEQLCIDQGGKWDPEICVPTVSEWGLIALALVLLTAGTIVMRHRHAYSPA